MLCAVRLLLLLAPAWLAGCDLLGIESASDMAARRTAEGSAIGAGCRYSGRPIEECYELNRRADKAAVLAGWREMNDYMAENKMESVRPSAAPTPDLAAQAAAEAAEPIADKKPVKSAKTRGG